MAEDHQLPAPQDGAEQVQGQQGASREIEQVKAEGEVLRDRMTRMQADFENARKRMVRQQQEFKDFAVADALSSLLPTLDSFDLALQSAPPTVEEFRSGIDLIRRQLFDTLSKLGLQRIPAQGERFNPHLHEAVEVVDTPTAKDDEVVDELRPGYRLGDRLLRPAMVVVGRKREK